MKNNKIELVVNRDQDCAVQVQEWQVTAAGTTQFTGVADLSAFTEIQVFLSYANGLTEIAKYTNASPTPAGWHALTTTGNFVNFTVFSEDTKEADLKDVYYSVNLFTDSARSDGETLKQQTDLEYLLTLVKQPGYTEEGE